MSNGQAGNTALHHAALLGHVAICELLLDSGADVNAVAVDGNTALHKAAQGGHAAIAQLLLARGVHHPLPNKVKGNGISHSRCDEMRSLKGWVLC